MMGKNLIYKEVYGSVDDGNNLVLQINLSCNAK
jgi:hypothetical protein